MSFFRSRRMLRVLGTAIIVSFLGGCFIAVSSLMKVDSSREAEAARNIIHQAKKGADHHRDNDHDYSAREHLRNEDSKAQVALQKGLWDNIAAHMGDRLRTERNRTTKFRSNAPLNQVVNVNGARNESHAAERVRKMKEADDAGLKDDPTTWPEPNYNIHAFYYPWYGNPDHDKTYLHWNHEILPHWNKREAKQWPSGRWQPPGEIGANFYPQLGCYSSRDPVIIEDHMKQLRLAGIGVLAMSWYPAGLSDQQGVPSDDLMPLYLDSAHKYGLKVTFHSEPYKGRTEMTFAEDVRYIINQYGSHPAFYRLKFKGRTLPVFYVYDSYLTNSSNWAQIFGINEDFSLRNSKYDGIFLALYADTNHKTDIVASSFDGFYTYFASSGFTYGSRWKNWNLLADFSRRRGLLFVPSVGPGYIDTRVRPWNTMNTKHRDGGKYYDRAFQAAVNVKPDIISVTSFNEWHEGTQIEQAVAKTFHNYTYLDYGPEGPSKYLLQTQKWARVFKGGR